jgi:luciferase family oxidoreductase group 1
MPPLKLSVLDLSPIATGQSGRQALLNTIDLAQWAEACGYTRYWLSEHHNSPGLASATPEILVGHVADATRSIRVGSGGIMLPNHSSLAVAEGFRLLEALHPGRIDLGLGRAPGTDALTAQALRRTPMGRDNFPEQLDELLGLFENRYAGPRPGQGIIAIPEDAPSPQVWMLSSSGYGGQVASALGIGLSFAHHIHPDPAVDCLKQYRQNFIPSNYFQAPRPMLCVAAVCAPTQGEAETLASSFDLVRLRIEKGISGKFPSAEEAAAYPYAAAEQQRILQNRERFFVGTPRAVKSQVSALAKAAGAEEVMVLTMVHDHQARRRSYALLAEAFGLAPAAL